MKQIFKTQSIFGFLLLCFSNNRDNIQTLGINELHINDLILLALQQTQSLALIDHIEIIYPDLRFEEKDPIFKTHNNQKWPYIKPYFYFVLMIFMGIFSHIYLQYRHDPSQYYSRFITKKEQTFSLQILFTICFFIFRGFYIKYYKPNSILYFLSYSIGYFSLIPLLKRFFYIIPFFNYFASTFGLFLPICFHFSFVEQRIKINLLKKEGEQKAVAEKEEKIKPIELAKILLFIVFILVLSNFFILKNKKSIMEKLLFLVPDFFLFSFLLLINIFPEYYYNVYSDFFRKKEKTQLKFAFFFKISLYDESKCIIPIGTVLFIDYPKQISDLKKLELQKRPPGYSCKDNHYLSRNAQQTYELKQKAEKQSWYPSSPQKEETNALSIYELQEINDPCACLVLYYWRQEQIFDFHSIIFDKKIYKNPIERALDKEGYYIIEK